MLNQFSGQTNGELRLFAGKTVLEFYSMDDDFTKEIWICVTMQCGLLVFWGLLGLFVINKVTHGSR